MHKKTVFFLALLLISGPVFARDGRPSATTVSRPIGAGIVVGSPTGVTGKLWIGSRNALDAALSVSSSEGLYLHFDYLWHDYRAFPVPEEGKLPLYYGLGPMVTSSGRFGVRPVIGIEYLFVDYPFDLFLELAPVIRLFPNADLNFTGCLGARYYWGR